MEANISAPRFVKAGTNNQLLSGSAVFLQSVVLTSKSGGASLSIYCAATASGLSPATMNRLLIRAGGPSAPPTVPLNLGYLYWPSGCAVSCSGAGALAVIGLSNRTRGM